jgi:hypothetical protein
VQIYNAVSRSTPQFLKVSQALLEGQDLYFRSPRVTSIYRKELTESKQGRKISSRGGG